MAKKLSLISKGIAIVFVIIGMIVFKIPVTELVPAAVFIAGAFIPVDISMITKNIKTKE